MSKLTSITFTLAILAFSLILISSCNDQDPIFELNGSRSDIITMLRSDDIVQRISVSSNDFIFFSFNGTRVNAGSDSFVFTDDGVLAEGMIDFEITELYTKSEILQYGIETKSNNSILESDGEFLFSASQNGRPLRLAGDNLMSLTVPNIDFNLDMELFGLDEGGWWPIQGGLNKFTSNGPIFFGGYFFFVNKLDWINIGYNTKFDFELTDISICLPEGYDNDRIALWVVFNDLDIVLNSSGENLPLGENISIVCIAAEDENTFRIDIKEVTVEEGLKVNLNPKIESSENIKALLKELD